jgi:t-SNARE complex subunit (syntaxin)
MSTSPHNFDGTNIQSGFGVFTLFNIVNNATVSAKTKLLEIQNRRSAISIGDMFEMQMLMNHLSQLSEMSTSVVAASNSAIQSMSRNVKS